MSWFGKYLRSSVGAKQAMAVSGLLLVLFSLVHMLGHLQMFGGPDMYNSYAHTLQSLWEVKWPVRAGLLGLLLLHMILGIGLATRNKAARPVGYAMYKPVRSSAVGRAMIWTGLALFAFLAFHILHFTVGLVQHDHYHVWDTMTKDPKERYDAYAMYVNGFTNPAIYGIYFIGIAILAMHLGHGAASWLQSLGWRHPKYPVDKLGTALAWILFVGYMLPPTGVLLHIIRMPAALGGA